MAMKFWLATSPRICVLALIFFFFMLLAISGSCLRLSPNHYISAVRVNEKVSSTSKDEHKLEDEQVHPPKFQERTAIEEPGMEVYPTGSSLPDCSHACGPCFPCKRVMVSFKCSVAESCPIVYRCMCKGKYYHVPSN